MDKKKQFIKQINFEKDEEPACLKVRLPFFFGSLLR